MCGIAGFVSEATPVTEREAAVDRMCAAMRHRGPDDRGALSRQEATIGGCRLAIFDPANGHQPMVSPDGRWSLVFNGAIYNFQELRTTLAAAGWPFRTDCDTEVLLAAFATWGPESLARLRGMYAFAAWDEHERTLYLARDTFGVKPLYYHSDGRQLVFASEIKALLEAGVVRAEIDPAAVADYLGWFAVPAPRTIYRGIFSLRPGEYATFRRGTLEIHQSWTFQSIPDHSAKVDYEDFIAELRTRLQDTIRAHILADVPVGAFLSGGLDSAVVVGLMTRASGTPLRTFCIGFDDASYSEGSDAEATARHFGSRHTTRVLTGMEVSRDLEKLLSALDQPTGDGVNTYYAAETARAGGVTVALSGLGGDELFGGYPSFQHTPRLARLLPWWRALPATLRHGIVNRIEKGDTRWRKLADMLGHARDIHEVGALQRRVFSESGRRSLLSPAAQQAIGAFQPFHPELERLAVELRGAGRFEIVSAWELRTYMADVLLRDSDVMSMRHSLELRVPFIDRPLMEWLWRQPAKASPRGTKSALYDAVADLLPPPLAHRRKKGFTLPFPIWMKRELRPFLDETFSTASVERSGLFATTEVQGRWRSFLAGHDGREWSRVWSLAVLVAFVNRRTAAPAPAPALAVTIRGEKQPLGRALLMAPEIFASEGGIPRILQLYLRAMEDLAPAGHVRLLALNDSPADIERGIREMGVAVDGSAGCSRRKLQFVQEAMRLAKGCDTIICGHIRQLPVAWLAKRVNPKLRYYLVAHGIEVWRPFTGVERVALRGAERILCISDYTRRELLSHCPLPAERSVVLPNALDPVFPIGPGRPLKDCGPIILTVTRLTYADRYKGVEHLIAAMPEILAEIPNATLRIIGRGDDVERLKAVSAQLGVARAVEFLGYVDDGRLATEIKSCRLFALPSRKEGFGLVFLEAMAQGRPCLGADAGGIPEVITPESGVLVSYGDVSAIAAACLQGLRRDWKEEAILARAREFSFASFTQRLSSLLVA